MFICISTCGSSRTDTMHWTRTAESCGLYFRVSEESLGYSALSDHFDKKKGQAAFMVNITIQVKNIAKNKSKTTYYIVVFKFEKEQNELIFLKSRGKTVLP